MNDPTPTVVEVNVRKFMDCWREYEKLVMPEDAPPEQREAMTHAFLTGAAMIVESISRMVKASAPRRDLQKRLQFMQRDIGSELALRDPNLERGQAN